MLAKLAEIADFSKTDEIAEIKMAKIFKPGMVTLLKTFNK